MKVITVCCLLCLAASVATAAPFSPKVMKLSAPAYVTYAFDGSNLSIPVNVTGVAGSGSFLVFTQDKAQNISKVGTDISGGIM